MNFILGLIVGLVIGAMIIYLIMRSKKIPEARYPNLMSTS